VDDEPQIHRFLRPTLVAAGFAVARAMNGAEALQRFRAAVPALVLLDLGLNDMDGAAVLAAIRQTSAVPVVILSARDNEAEKVALLNAGADDYIGKPFGVSELVARLHNALRHAAAVAGATGIFEAGDLTVDTIAHRVTLKGEPIRLTPREYDLLYLLARHAGRLLTHQRILKEVWGGAHGEHAQNLRVFVGRLRQKIEADAADPQLLLTEAGVGYRLAAPLPPSTGAVTAATPKARRR
jgi:two-component system KDP operon response regulator KdpE